MRRVRLFIAVAAVGLVGSMLGIAGTSESADAAATAPGRASVSETTTATAIPSSNGTVSALSGAPAAGPAITDAVSFRIVNYKSGRCLGIAGGADNAPAVLWNCVNGSANQSWHWDISVVIGGVYARLINGDGECLGVAGGSQKEGADIYGWSCAGDPYNQFWTTIGTGISGYYYIYNWGSDLVIGVAGGSTANGAQLVQWKMLSHSDQYWNLPYGA